MFTDGEDAEEFSDSNVEENAVYVGTTVIADEESATMGADWLHAFSTFDDAYAQVEDGGTIYVVGQVTIDHWPATANGKNVTISAFYSEKPENLADKYAENYQKTMVSKIAIGGDIVFSGDTVFSGWNYTDSSKSKKLYITNADNKNHEIYPEGHKLQIGSIDSSSRPYDDVEIIDYNSTRRGYANLHITTELKDTSKAENAGVIDLRFYGNNKYYISNYNSHTDSVFYGYDSVNLEIIGTDAGSYSVNQNGGWGNNSRAYIKNASYTNAVLPSLSEKTKSVTVEFRNFQTDGAVHIHTEKGTKQEYLTPANYTEKQSYTHGYIGSTFTVGSYYTTQDAEINLNDIYLSGIFCQNIWHSVCEKLTYNMVNTTIARIRGQWQNSGYAGSMSKNVLTVNMNNSKILDEAYLYTDYEPENGYSVVINASGTSSIGGEIYTRASDSIKLNIDSNSSFSDKLSDFQMDIAIADGGTLILPSGEARCKKIESTGTANIRLQPVSRFRIRDSISGNYKISIAGITGIADAGKTTSLNCSWSAGSAGEATEVTYAGNDADEAITAITNKDNGSYYSEDWSVITDSSAIYVKDSGSDTNDGSSYWNAVSTLSKAYEMAVKSNKSKIIVCGKVSYGNDVKKYTNGVWNLFQSEDSSKEMITVTSVATAGDGNTQKFEEGYIELVPVTKSAANMPSNFNYINNLCQMIKFENISLVSSSSSANIFANGNKLIIGENVTTPLGTALYGGSLGEGVSSTDLTVESGTYGTINGGCVKKDSSSTLTIGGDVSVKVTGATFSVADGESKYVSDKAWAGNVIGSGPGIVKGNISVEVDGTNGTVKKPIQIIGLASRGNYELAYAKDVVAEGQVSVSVKDVNFANSTISAVIGVWDGWADHVDVSVSDCNSAYSYSVMAYNSYYRGGIEQKENGTASIHISGSSNIAGVFGNSNYNSGTPEKLNGKLSVNIKNSSVDKIYLGNGNFTENGISASAGVASDRKVFSSAELNITDSDITDINGLNYGSDNYVEDYNRTADIKGKCSISGEVYGFNGFSSGDESAKSSLKFSGKVLQAEKSAFVNTDATFLQSCSIMGNYEAKEAVTFRIGQNGTLSFNGKIEGSTRLCSVNSIETATVRVLDYSLENVPRQTNAFTGENIEFAQENSIAVWTIEGKDPREKREVIYVRDAVEGESTLDSDQENYIKEHDGSGYESAVQTIEEAYRLLDTSSGSSTIVVCGKLTVKNNYVTPECEGKVYWTSVNGETDYRTQEENPAFLFLSGKNSAYLGINSDLLIQNINICYESTGSVGIDANGNELCIGTNLGTEESKAQVSDVKITPAVDGQMGTGNPQNFYAIGAGVYSSQVDQVQMELHNTAVGGIIILYGEVTVGSKEVPGSVEVTVRDTDLLQGKYYISGYESGAISTSTVYGEMTVSEELYSRDLLTFVEPTLGQNTIVTGDATRNYVNKTSYTKTFDWTKFENYVNTEKNVTLLVDGKDTQRINDSTASFKTTYLMPLTGTLTKSENINIILLGNIIIDNQYWIWEPEKINEKGSLRLQLGDRERGSYVTLRNFLSDNGPKTTERVKKSIRIEVYPGTRIGSSQDNYISADNYTENSEYKWPVCTTEEGYPMFVFYGSEAEPTPTYHIRKMRDFSIEADGCSVLNEDAQSVISSLSLKNGGSYEETFNTSGSITLKKSRLADTEQIIGGGNLSVSGEKNQLADITGFSVEGDCTIENAELNVEGENSFGSITGIGNASLNAEPGSTITTGKINADKILLNCSSEEAPTAANGKLPVSVTVNAADVNENLVQAGVTANGTQIEALEFVKNADSVVWTMGNENTDSYRIFISDSGDDSKSGMDAADAVKTFNRAFEIIQTLDVKPSEENSTSVYHVIVCGTIDWKQEISGFDPEGCQVVVEPLSKRYRKIKIEDFICFPASVTLKNFEFIGSDTLVSPAAVYAEGHSLTIGTENTTEGPKDCCQ